MEILFHFLVFVFGLLIGSFLNCVIYRMELQEDMPKGSPCRKAVSFLRGKSFCPHCKHILSWQDLIPILSFLILRGRCRYCQKPISWQYPLVEISTGLLFLIIFNLSTKDFLLCSGLQFLNLCFLFFVSCSLIIIFVYDLKHYIIPDKIIYPAIAIALIFNFQFLISKQFLIFNYSILSAFLAAGLFLAIVLISKGKWMGVGDIKLAFLMGFMLGWPNILVALFSAFLIGAIIGIGLMAAGRKKLKSEIPFGPFLVTGTFLAMFWGKQIVDWYLNFFLPL